MMRQTAILLVLAWGSSAFGQGDPAREANEALSLAHQGKYELAIAHYKLAIAQDARLPGLYLNFGLALFKLNRLAEAASAFEKALKADPANFQSRVLLGMSYFGLRQYPAAAAVLKTALEQQPDNRELRYKLAQSYLWSGEYPEATEQFRLLLSKDPDSAPVHMLLGEVLDAANHTEEATAEFVDAAKASPREAEVHFGLGYLYWKQKRYEDARREFQAELNIDPKHTQALAYLGDSEMQSGDQSAAEQHLRGALKLDTNLRLAHLDLGIISTKSDPQAAVRHFQEAIRIDSSRPDAHYRLGRLWLSLGREQDANAEFATVKQLAANEKPDPLVKFSREASR
jgi:tetratricopeptide (TPR) repeat protein